MYQKNFTKNLKYNKANNIYNGINTIEQEYNQYSSNDFTDKEFVVYSDRNENTYMMILMVHLLKQNSKSGKRFM